MGLDKNEFGTRFMEKMTRKFCGNALVGNILMEKMARKFCGNALIGNIPVSILF